MLQLDVLKYQDRLDIKIEGDERWIRDPFRKKWLVLQPEEFVRQLMVLFLIHELNYNPNRILVEQELIYNEEVVWRFDLMVLAPDLTPWMLVECKAPEVPLDQKVIDQVARYNISLKVPYVLVTSGRLHYCWSLDHANNSFELLSGMPAYPAK